MNDSFEEYMKFYKAQSLKEKQSIILEQLQILTGFTNSICKEINVNNEILVNRELVDVKKEDYTEDDFAESVIVYINSIQNSICDYVNGMTNFINTLDNENN